jgi:hypothetical protein
MVIAMDKYFNGYIKGTVQRLIWLEVVSFDRSLFKGLSHEIDFKNFDQTLKNLTY